MFIAAARVAQLARVVSPAQFASRTVLADNGF
jgi:hypothetical protein